MSSDQFLIVLVAIWSIIPCLVVAVVLFLRILAGERRIEAMEIRKLDLDNVNNALATIRTNQAEQAAQVLNLEESLTHLSNKWNSRQRVETAAERRKEKKDKDDTPDNGSADLDGMNGGMIPEQYRLPLQTPQTQKQRRAFGEFPH